MPSAVSKPTPITSVSTTKPLKNLSKNEKLVLAASTQNEKTAEDALLALSLLQQYKRDTNFIQKELKDQAKKRDLVMGTSSSDNKPRTSSTAPAINPQLTQEERHRAINEKREQRKREQRLKQLEESKERRIVKEPPQQKLKSTNEALNDISVGVTEELSIGKIREAKVKIEKEAME